MKPDFQTKLLLHLIEQHQDTGSTSLAPLLILVILAIMVMAALPVFLHTPNRGKISEAKPYTGSMNRAQQAYHFSHGKFSTTIADLGLGIKTQTDNYSYGVQVHSSTAVTNKGASLKQPLKSYVGGTVVYRPDNSTESTTISVLCESNGIGAHRSSAELPNIRVKVKGEPTCPAGYSDLSKR